MARNRMLNPEFWLDEEVSELTPHARLLYMGLWGICDDNYATLPDKPEWIRAQIFPYENTDTRPLLVELSKIGKIIKFRHEDHDFWYIKNFFKHQRVDRPSKPKYPAFEPQNEVLDEGSTRARPEVKLREVKLSKEKRDITPLDLATNFFEKGTYYDELLKMFSEGSNADFIGKEFDKFILYWTEPNKTGTRVRWEQQSTFEVKRRLYVWLSK
jgi:hypothetical protein